MVHLEHTRASKYGKCPTETFTFAGYDHKKLISICMIQPLAALQ